MKGPGKGVGDDYRKQGGEGPQDSRARATYPTIRAPFGETSTSRVWRETSHHMQATPTGTQEIRSANAVGSGSGMAPHSRAENIAENTAAKIRGLAVEVCAPVSSTAIGMMKAMRVATIGP